MIRIESDPIACTVSLERTIPGDSGGAVAPYASWTCFKQIQVNRIAVGQVLRTEARRIFDLAVMDEMSIVFP